MADIDDIFVPPNAGGYEKREIREGMPLEYVGEKLGQVVASSTSARVLDRFTRRR